MGGRVVGLARGRPSDQGVNLDELRLVRSGLLGLGDDVSQTLDVLLVGAVRLDEAELVGVPAVCLEALEHVLGQHQVGVVVEFNGIKAAREQVDDDGARNRGEGYHGEE